MKKLNIEHLIYFVALFFLVSSNLLCNVTLISNYLVTLRLISYLIFMVLGTISLMKEKNIKIKFVFLIIVLFFLSFCTYIKADSTILLDLFFVLLASYRKKFDEVIKMDLFIKIVITILILVAHRYGFANSNFVVTRDDLFVRESFGFYHPNTFGMYIMMIYFDIVILLKKKVLFKSFIYGTIATLIIYYTSNSRTAYTSIILFLILLILYSMFNFVICHKKELVIKKRPVYEWLFPILTFVSLILTKLYDMKLNFVIQLDKVLSNRLYLQAINMRAYPIKFFGDKIDIIRTLDNGYIKLLINFGIVSFLFFSIIYKKMISNSINNKRFILTIIYFVLIYFTLSESSLLFVYYNIFYVYIVSQECLSGDES